MESGIHQLSVCCAQAESSALSAYEELTKENKAHAGRRDKKRSQISARDPKFLYARFGIFLWTDLRQLSEMIFCISDKFS